MLHKDILNFTNDCNNLNTSRIYFELDKSDSFSTKFININAIDYEKLEKTYIKNVSISIKYGYDKDNYIQIGNLEATCFDFNEALSDKIDIENLLKSEGLDAYNIYSAIINNFNKDYYSFFGYKNERNILNITNIDIIDNFYNSEVIYHIIKNIHKVIYHLLGLKISTILCLNTFDSFNDKNSIDIYTKLGFLEVDNNSNFLAKNIEHFKEFYQQDSNLNLCSKQTIINEFKKILSNRENVINILKTHPNNTF